MPCRATPNDRLLGFVWFCVPVLPAGQGCPSSGSCLHLLLVSVDQPVVTVWLLKTSFLPTKLLRFTWIIFSLLLVHLCLLFPPSSSNLVFQTLHAAHRARHAPNKKRASNADSCNRYGDHKVFLHLFFISCCCRLKIVQYVKVKKELGRSQKKVPEPKGQI